MANKKLFDLPETPIDKYKIEYWSVDYYGYEYHISHIEAVYFVNTPYETLNPGIKGGAQIKDDWMIYDDGRCTGRLPGWEKMGENHERFDDCFLTLQGARDYAVKQTEGSIANLEEQIARLRKVKEHLAGKVI